MNTKAALILSLALIISTILYCFGTRYQMVMVKDTVTAYMYDRITGKSWCHIQYTYFPNLSRQELKERHKQQDKLVDKLVDELYRKE